MIIALITENPHSFWLSLGGVLLVAELLGAGGYLLWSGISALLVGLLSWIFPMSWEWRCMLFAVLTIVTAVIWWYWLRRRQQQPDSRGDEHLNQRSRQLIGRRATLNAPIENGSGRIELGDGSWRVQCDQDLPAGTHVEITDVQGITLIVKAV
ncbi:NfeD family protein [Enterobacillus tribolii]|uniref:NfeD-like C-terminal domain-containing protein n=1 Tax=Enterobacillus tribolii TaxID=1487935 RepID=A0A370QSH7_9GAMM|nr:NfeD family protein [Enterobacillus tribolii]RDK92131.1 hypothetical protein C8D90_104289 [Enterobacillus tribolii]